ncbi:hypothetical protein C8J57DRAFT_1572122 [Mycena rebaudengoi]|nr:hypothetical protein C8J57DRAFT_1572122 [Mycena rebaudengoi]
MANGVEGASNHTPADQEYIGSLSPLTLMEFRNHIFNPICITNNATKFLDYEWVNIALLRKYVQQTAAISELGASTTRSFPTSDLVRIKIEAIPPPATTVSVKAEPKAVHVPCVKMRTLQVGKQEVIELLSDSEPETDDPDSDLEVIEALRHASRSSSVLPLHDADHLSEHNSDLEEFDEGSDDGNSDLVPSDTIWLDGGTSHIRIGTFRPTQKLTVERMEYRDGPAAIYPIHRVRTGIVVDLSDENITFATLPKICFSFQLSSSSADLGLCAVPVTGTAAVSTGGGRDNDSWQWRGGSASAQVTFSPGEKPIACRCIRYECKGVHACDKLDAALRTAVRFELDDPAPRKAIVIAQQETRRREGNTAEERVVLFMKIIRNAKCHAVDSQGNKCRGGPILKPKPQGPSRGRQLFVGCSGWTPKFTKDHRTHSIPDNVNEDLLAKGLAGLPLADDLSKDTAPCSGIIHPHTGLKKKLCPHAHIVNGMQVQGQIQQYSCNATRSIYVPKDQSIRKVLIIHNTGHNHPMPVLTKVAFGHKDTYRQCIHANGVLGATVSKIDDAQSTKLVLGGKTPTAHAPALHNKRAKRAILHAEKLKSYPNGLGIDAIYATYRAELTKPLPERYIHSYIETPKGEKIIVTFVPYLLKLLDDPGVTSFEGDTTFKGVVQRAASVLHAYINGASADFFELLFDELQRRKLEVTGKPISFEIFVPGGNLLVANVDMDTAQVIGLCLSVLSFSDPEYSGIPKTTPPEQIAPKIIKSCWRHGKEPIHDFRPPVSPEEFRRLQDCFYVDSKESLDAFSWFVYNLKVPKITAWWRHKEINDWIIPCLIKSQSQIPADIWDSTPSTTITNEAQHHWTNSLTGIKLTPVEALESRRGLDHNVAQEIKMSLETGILSNHNNEISHRMARNSQRQSHTARKARESHEAADISKDLQLRIEAEAEKRRISNELTKSLKAQLKDAKGTTEVPAPVPPAQSDNVPSAVVALNSGAQPACPSLADGANLVQYVTPEPTFNSLNCSLDFDSLMHDLVAGNEDETWSFLQDPAAAAEFFATYDPASDPTSFVDSNTPIPSNEPPKDSTQNFTDLYANRGGFSGVKTAMPSEAPPEDPGQDFLDLYGSAGGFSDAGAAQSFAAFTSTWYFNDPLPVLPPPPPESPAPPPSVEKVSEPGPIAPRSRCTRQEVDEANIIHTTRTRAPSARKRGAEDDDDVSSRPLKRGRQTGDVRVK